MKQNNAGQTFLFLLVVSVAESQTWGPVCGAAAQGSLDEELRQGGGLQLNESQRAEFYRIQEQAGAKTARLNADLRTLQTTQVRSLPPAFFSPCFYYYFFFFKFPFFFGRGGRGGE